MKEKSSNVSIKLSIVPKDPPKDLHSCLAMVFWKEPGMVDYAAAFLSYVRDWNRSGSPHKAGDWRKYCAKSGLTQSQYSNMLKRLRRSGMVEKRYNPGIRQHEIIPSLGFSDTLESAARAWDTFLKY